MSAKEINDFIRKDNERFGDDFQELTGRPQKTLRNNAFYVEVYEAPDEMLRLSVNRTELEDSGRWKDGISWDDLQKIKSQLGYSDRDAVEVYPKDQDVINTANKRHLWVLPEGRALEFIWRKR